MASNSGILSHSEISLEFYSKMAINWKWMTIIRGYLMYFHKYGDKSILYNYYIN